MSKRVRAAWFILGVAALLTIFSHAKIHSFTTQTCDALLQIRSQTAQKNYQEAAQTLDSLLYEYERHQHFLEFFIKRETVLSISVSLHGLTAYLQPNSIADLYSEIDKAYTQLRMMEHLFTAIV